MSRLSGQRRDAPDSFMCNVATLGPTLRRSQYFFFVMSRCWGQRRDVAERLDFPRHDVESNVATFPRSIFFPRREVGTQHHNVLERYFINVAMLEPNVVTFLGGQRSDVEPNIMTLEPNDLTLELTLRRSRDHQPGIVHKFSKCRKLPVFSFTLPQSLHKLSILFLLSRSNLGTLKHCNTNTSKLKQAKSNLTNLKQENLMTKII